MELCRKLRLSGKKAYRRQRGVKSVNVSLSHEEVLVYYDPSQATLGTIEKTLTDLGYTIRDPKRVKALEEQGRELRLVKRFYILENIK
ncbi:MAG TPA: heavy-metal-associated domain-containing protein [Spirochaetes bacterium]|nr:heavy-metal-associated domain-containing protein [Spirochaetota bacterium]